ncbi:MAG: DNA methyltransferase [Patescibacteria group bacterium]|nr:DNA methyltransferase [Patescibacteria group bacterium]
MDYIFILGTHPAWSVAEIASVLGESGLYWENERILVKKDAEIAADSLMKRLGGTLKIAQIETFVPADTNFAKIAKICADILVKKAARGEGKLVFGLSDNGVGGRFAADKLGLNIKKELKTKGISARLVTSRDKELSSVVVGQNKLLSKGAELIFFRHGSDLFVARTLAIQPYKDLSRRDFGRPSRDDHSGMLPPKLAQMMINCAATRNFSDTLLDPFCGSGTIITEAMLMGYRQLIGTDLSEKAVKDSRANAEWVRELYGLDIHPKFHIKNATRLAQFFKPKTIGTIVSEPYLGPQRGLDNIEAVKTELQALYTQALDNFYQILSPGGRAVMVWPVFFGREFLKPALDKWKPVKALPEKFSHLPWVKLSYRDTLIYHRAGQRVWRELIILEK